ncbi:MAG: transposase [Ktedonobacteraceae bacterium]
MLRRARELGISDTSIHQWRKELTQQGHEAFPGSGHQIVQEEELRQLKRELARVRQERDIVKKAVAIFSRNQPEGFTSSKTIGSSIQ